MCGDQSRSANSSNAVPPVAWLRGVIGSGATGTALGAAASLISAAHAIVSGEQILGDTISGAKEPLAQCRGRRHAANRQRIIDNFTAARSTASLLSTCTPSPIATA
jgi:hypothetical protein